MIRFLLGKIRGLTSKSPIREAVDRVFLTEASRITAQLLENEVVRSRVARRISVLLEEHIQALGEVDDELEPATGPGRSLTEEERRQTKGWRAARARSGEQQ